MRALSHGLEAPGVGLAHRQHLGTAPDVQHEAAEIVALHALERELEESLQHA